MLGMRWIAFFACLAALAQSPSRPSDVPVKEVSTGKEVSDIDISGKDAWVDTKLDLRPGDKLTITATGTMKTKSGKNTTSVTAAGANRGFRDLIKTYQVNEAGQGALIGRIGSSEAANPFLVGASKSWTSPRAGRLFLGINKASGDAPDGTFR